MFVWIITQLNVYGLDLAGKINPNNQRYFYLKDHLGSVHAVIDSINKIITANDFDHCLPACPFPRRAEAESSP